MFAAGRLGAVFVPFNTRLAEPELRHCLTGSGTSLLVHAPSFGALARACGVSRTVIVDDTYEDASARADGSPLDKSVSPDDIALIMYTSGTTGRAKGPPSVAPTSPGTASTSLWTPTSPLTR